MIAQAAAQTFTLYNIALIFAGLLIGMIIGCIPGLSVTLGIILMLPLTYNMPDAASAIILMLAVYVGGMYGGSISPRVPTPPLPRPSTVILWHVKAR